MVPDAAKVEFENDRVKVTRVKAGQCGQKTRNARRDRLIIYLEDGHVRRIAGSQHEEVQRKAGDLVWREQSQHEVENLEDKGHHVVIVEFKK